jgi:ribosomal protein S8
MNKSKLTNCNGGKRKMAYEIVTKLKCITNEMLDDKGYVRLTVGETYDSAYCNSTTNSVTFGVYDDEGYLGSFSERYFTIEETKTRENLGWEIECQDCYKKVSIKQLEENDYKCPRCDQKFK